MVDFIDYQSFRTGLTFKDVRLILHIEADKKYANGEYMFITRRTVLGRWHEIKLRMYRQEEQLFNSYNKQ